jgi:hypothetical protein
MTSGGNVRPLDGKAQKDSRGGSLTRATLKRQKSFQPCPVETDEECLANGIFEFNITRLLATVEACPDQYPVRSIDVADIPDWGGSGLNADTVSAADLSRPVVFAEIAPGMFNLIDGHHRVARARRDGVPTVPAFRIACPDHVPFLTSVMAYEKYIEYWNSKLDDRRRELSSRRRRRP